MDDVKVKQGRVQPTTTVNGQKVNDNPALEKEADVMGAKAASVQMKSKTTKNTNELSSQTVQRVVQRQQTDIALKSAILLRQIVTQKGLLIIRILLLNILKSMVKFQKMQQV